MGARPGSGDEKDPAERESHPKSYFSKKISGFPVEFSCSVFAGTQICPVRVHFA
jgi:hypothetical protein